VSRKLFKELTMDIVDEAAQANEKRPENAMNTGIMCQPSASLVGKSPRVV
jgi:hypothetical protein